MILVDDVGGIVPAISHSPWDGVKLADFVFPFFLFIVGVALAFAYKVLSLFLNYCRHFLSYISPFILFNFFEIYHIFYYDLLYY
jgi:predicted acyltransferase